MQFKKIFCDVYYTTKEVSAFGAPFPGWRGAKNMLQILTIFSALQGDVVFRATVRKSDFHMSHANYTMQHRDSVSFRAL